MYRWAPRPRALASPSGVSVRRILVLCKGPNATVDYYLRARLRLLSMPYRLCSIDEDTLGSVEPEGTFVIVCRYIRLAQCRWLNRNRDRLAGVAYFVDDDIPALVAEHGSDPGYRAYLSYFGCLPLPRLNRALDQVWVSTPALAKALSRPGQVPAVLPPAPIIADHMPMTRLPQSDRIRIVYHATNIHHREHAFIVPVMEAVCRLRPHVDFEVIARGANRRRWSGAAVAADRLTILPPMDWEHYCRYSRNRGGDIALVPLLAGLANDCRADTKFIDCRRMGAAAIVSDVAPYRRRMGAGVVAVANTLNGWVEGVLRLVDDPVARQRAGQAVSDAVATMVPDPAEPFPGLRVAGSPSREMVP